MINAPAIPAKDPHAGTKSFIWEAAKSMIPFYTSIYGSIDQNTGKRNWLSTIGWGLVDCVTVVGMFSTFGLAPLFIGALRVGVGAAKAAKVAKLGKIAEAAKAAGVFKEGLSASRLSRLTKVAHLTEEAKVTLANPANKEIGKYVTDGMRSYASTLKSKPGVAAAAGVAQPGQGVMGAVQNTINGVIQVGLPTNSASAILKGNAVGVDALGHTLRWSGTSAIWKLKGTEIVEGMGREGQVFMEHIPEQQKFGAQAQKATATEAEMKAYLSTLAI